MFASLVRGWSAGEEQNTTQESDGLKIHLSATDLVFLGVGRNLGAGLARRA